MPIRRQPEQRSLASAASVPARRTHPRRHACHITHPVILYRGVTGAQLREARTRAGWKQRRLASRLRVTQAFLSLVESGKRRLSGRHAEQVVRLLRLSPTALPLDHTAEGRSRTDNEWVLSALARLGYPGYAYRKTRGRPVNPGEVLLRALALDGLDPRLVEALPWLLLRFEGYDLDRLVEAARLANVQNCLGFVATLARAVAERSTALSHRSGALRALEDALEPYRLAREDGFWQERISARMRAWVLANRSAAAEHWNVLTDLAPEHLTYAS